MTQRNNHFHDEFGIIPEWVVWLAGFGFLCMVYGFLGFMPRHLPNPPPLPLRCIGAFVGGAAVAAYLLLIGYVNQDAKRRDMGQALWTFMVILIPNGIGFLAYFLLRKPILDGCPKCGERVEKGFHYCPKCGCEISPSCGHCGHAVSRDFVVCPYCGKALGAQNV